ncbi:hypothetical protein [Kibdelosporangium philippinense]|uniref:hypothetical protein n=1 Tax=Kibdelosporangium philippinense TaxID=211113 RepID=UPI00361F7C89
MPRWIGADRRRGVGGCVGGCGGSVLGAGVRVGLFAVAASDAPTSPDRTLNYDAGKDVGGGSGW